MAGDVEDGRDGRPGLGELVDHVLGVALGDPRADGRVELVLVLDPPGVACEPRLVDDVAPPHQAHGPLRGGLAGARQAEPDSVPALVQVAGRGERRPVAGAALDQAELVIDGALRSEHAEEGFVDRQVDLLADTPALVAPVQGGHDREGGGHGGHAVGQGERRQGGRAVGVAVDVGEARHRLGQGAEPGPVAIGPGLAEAGDPGHHQPGVALMQGLPSQSPPLQCPRPEVLDEHVGTVEQPQHGLPAPRMGELDGDAPLVAVGVGPPERDPVLLPAEASQVVAARVLDLDHIRAVVGEQRGRDRPGEDGGRVHYLDRRQGGGVAVRHGSTAAVAGDHRQDSTFYKIALAKLADSFHPAAGRAAVGRLDDLHRPSPEFAG